MEITGIESGPLFRPRLAPRSEALGDRAITERTMNRLLMGCLDRLPGAVHDMELPGGANVRRGLYSPHSLRATAATMLLDSGVPIEAVQDLLRPQAHHHHADLRQAPPGGEGFRLPQDAAVNLKNAIHRTSTPGTPSSEMCPPAAP